MFKQCMLKVFEVQSKIYVCMNGRDNKNHKQYKVVLSLFV